MGINVESSPKFVCEDFSNLDGTIKAIIFSGMK
jgi:hypothetical protein